MWRFILVVFGLIGVSFYHLSGGADYNPRAGSLQASNFTVFRTPEVTQTQLASAPGTEPVEVVTRAAFDPAELPKLNTQLPQIATPGGVTPMFEPAKLTAAVAQAAAAAVPEPEPVKDLRQVKGARVNMRMGPGTRFDIAAKLTKGTPVEVIRDTGDGWVKLRVAETGRIGWMADNLLTAAN